jgi:hypothetical protein
MGHINSTTLIFWLAVGFAFRAVALFAFLTIMIKIQKLDFKWLPLIGASLLASGLDLIPVVGHFIAVPTLYLCVWKWARCDSIKDATFTVVISYAFVQCLTLILLAYVPVKIPAPRASQDNFNFANDAGAQPLATNQSLAVVQSTPEPAQTDTTPAAAPVDSSTPAISIKGVIHSTTGAMVTIQCGKKDYTLSQDEGVTVSTDQGMVPVHFVQASGNEVTLSVGGQDMKYALK